MLYDSVLFVIIIINDVYSIYLHIGTRVNFTKGIQRKLDITKLYQTDC